MPSRKKRLLLLTNRFHPELGGAEWNIFLQAQELSKHFDVDVFTPLRDRYPRRQREGRVRITRGIDLYNLKREFPNLKSETLCPGVFLKTLLGNYDVIHCFPGLSRNIVLALAAARVRRIPVFLSNFDLVDYRPLVESGRPIREELDKLSLSPRKSQLLGRMSAIFTISVGETNIIKQANPNTFLSTVPIVLDEYEQEVDVSDFKQRYGVPDDVPVILCLGRVARLKGQDLLVRALPLLRDQLERFHVLIVGRTDYEPDYVAGMEEFIRQNDLRDRVTITGGVPRKDVIGALKACDVHVLPVRFMNSGAVVVETWAARKPVLHSDMIDPCYVVEGENGFTFRSEDIQDLCDKLVPMLQDAELRHNMGVNGRRLVEEKFLYPHLIQQYLEAYKKYGGVTP
jgi:glycosyltransferase involved in cell wall biosynthesis